MQDFQQRVINEKQELDEKLCKLSALLISSESIPREEMVLLTKQAGIMVSYSSILGERISTFK